MTREEAIKYLKAWNPIHPLKQEARDMAAEALKQTEIVRCKDCKYNTGPCSGLYAAFVTCYKTGTPHKKNWYCADGKRKDEH